MSESWYRDPEYVAFCHAADMDGLGCALLLHRFTSVAEIRFLDYPVPEDLGAEGKVVVCDLNLAPDSPAWQNPDLVVFDHHGAAPEGAKAREVVARDGGDACATRLLFEHLNAWLDRQWRTTGAEFVAMINAGDLHLTEDRLYSRSRSYSWLLNKAGIETVFAMARKDPGGFIDLPEELLRAVDIARRREDLKAWQAAMMLARPRERDGLKFQVTWLLPCDRSEVLGQLAEDMPPPIVGLCLDAISDTVQITASVRDPRGGARALAEAFGGGGHRNAAGFTIPLDQALALWQGDDPDE